MALGCIVVLVSYYMYGNMDIGHVVRLHADSITSTLKTLASPHGIYCMGRSCQKLKTATKEGPLIWGKFFFFRI